MNLIAPFLAVLRAQGNKPAVLEPNGTVICFDELYRQIAAFAEQLRRRGMKPGDPVVVQIPSGVAFAVATIATLALGGVAVLCEPGLGDAVYLGRLAAANPKWALVHPIIVWANRIPGVRALLRRRELHVPPVIASAPGLNILRVSKSMLAQQAIHVASSQPIAVAERDTQDDAIIIFTGGTTSVPKGVRLSHGALQTYLANITGIANSLSVSTFLADTPQQMLYGLQMGHTVMVTKGRTQRRAAYVLRVLREGKADAYFGSPFLWVEMMAQTGPNREPLPGSLKAVLLGGAPVTPDFLRTLKKWLHPDTRVMAIYGLTEAGPVCVASAEEKLGWTDVGDFVGAPLPGVRLELADSDGEAAEVIVHSPALYTGYLGESPRSADEGLRTGDLGRLVTHNGTPGLQLLGRKKDMIIRGGVNVYPSTVEPLLRQIVDGTGTSQFRECALIGLWNDESQDEEIILCYQPNEGIFVDAESVRRSVEAISGSDAAPNHYLEVNPIPVTGRQNKVDKNALRKLAAAKFGRESQPGGRMGNA